VSNRRRRRGQVEYRGSREQIRFCDQFRTISECIFLPTRSGQYNDVYIQPTTTNNVNNAAVGLERCGLYIGNNIYIYICITVLLFSLSTCIYIFLYYTSAGRKVSEDWDETFRPEFPGPPLYWIIDYNGQRFKSFRFKKSFFNISSIAGFR